MKTRLLSLALFLLTSPALALLCADRDPSGVSDVAPQENDAGFYLEVNGNPATYQPGELYTVSLKVTKKKSFSSRKN